jgi:hypothetical protein
MSRDDCDICDKYNAEVLANMKMYKESSEAANRIIENQLQQIDMLEKRVRELEKKNMIIGGRQ